MLVWLMIISAVTSFANSLLCFAQITVFHPGEGGRGVAIGDNPPPPPPSCKTYTFKTLPDKYFKKYQYAAK